TAADSMWSFGMIRMCVGACGLTSRNAMTSSLSCTTSAGVSPAPILQNRQSLAVSAIAPNLTEASVPGEDQRCADHRGRLRSENAVAERRDEAPRAFRAFDLAVGEPTLGPDDDPEPAAIRRDHRGQPVRRTVVQE